MKYYISRHDARNILRKTILFYFLFLFLYRVCYHSVATVQRTSHIVYTAIRQTYTFQCWFLRCSGTKYRAVSLIQYRAVYQMQQRCCNGFKGDGYLCERMTINHINIIYNYYIIFTIRIEGNVAILF